MYKKFIEKEEEKKNVNEEMLSNIEKLLNEDKNNKYFSYDKNALIIKWSYHICYNNHSKKDASYRKFKTINKFDEI